MFLMPSSFILFSCAIAILTTHVPAVFCCVCTRFSFLDRTPRLPCAATTTSIPTATLCCAFATPESRAQDTSPRATRKPAAFGPLARRLSVPTPADRSQETPLSTSSSTKFKFVPDDDATPTRYKPCHQLSLPLVDVRGRNNLLGGLFFLAGGLGPLFACDGCDAPSLCFVASSLLLPVGFVTTKSCIALCRRFVAHAHSRRLVCAHDSSMHVVASVHVVVVLTPYLCNR